MNAGAIDYGLGCRLPVEEWAHLNRVKVFNDPSLMRFVGPFPPVELMQNTTGLTSQQVFAGHGVDFWESLSEASPKKLSEFDSVLDFGCGCGRLARMFKGHPGRIAGCDIDHRHVDWCARAVDYMDARLSRVHPPTPFGDNEFEAIISISIFTHLTEKSQNEFLQELARLCRPGGVLFLTTHGERALERALTEPGIRAMLEVREDLFQRARQEFARGNHAFIVQREGHLTTIGEQGPLTGKVITEPFEYGITFIPESYVRTRWTKWFDVLGYRRGGIHDFQDIVVLRPKK